MTNTIGSIQRLLPKLACPLIVVIIVAGSLQAQDNPAPALVKKPAQTTETLTPIQVLELNEIAALRAKMGGGVSERLQGAVPGTDPEQQFHDSLKDLASKEKTATATLLPTATAQPSKLSNRPTTNAAQTVLRDSAKKLEYLAAELEQVQIYDKADELRKIAAKYWLQARTMD